MKRILVILAIGAICTQLVARAQDTIQRSWSYNLIDSQGVTSSIVLGDSIFVLRTDSLRVHSTTTREKLWTIPFEAQVIGIMIQYVEGVETVVVAKKLADTLLPYENYLIVSYYMRGELSNRSAIKISRRAQVTDPFHLAVLQASPSGRFLFVTDGHKTYFADLELRASRQYENISLEGSYNTILDDRITFNSDESKMAVTKRWLIYTFKGKLVGERQRNIVYSTDVQTSEPPDVTYDNRSEPVVFSPKGKKLIVGRYVLEGVGGDTIAILPKAPIGTLMADGLCSVYTEYDAWYNRSRATVVEYGSNKILRVFQMTDSERQQYSYHAATSNGTVCLYFKDNHIALYRIPQGLDTCVLFRSIDQDSLREHTPFKLSYSYIPVDRDLSLDIVVNGLPHENHRLIIAAPDILIAKVSLIDGDSSIVSVDDSIAIKRYGASPRSVWRGSAGYVNDARLSPDARRLAVVGSTRCVFTLDQTGIAYYYGAEQERANTGKDYGSGGQRTGWIDNDQFVFLSSYGEEYYDGIPGHYSRFVGGVVVVWYDSSGDSLSTFRESIESGNWNIEGDRTWAEFAVPQQQPDGQFVFLYSMGLQSPGRVGSTHMVALTKGRIARNRSCYGSRSFDIQPKSNELFFTSRFMDDTVDRHAGSWLSPLGRSVCDHSLPFTSSASRFVCDGAFLLLDSLVISTRTWTAIRRVDIAADGVSIPRTRLYLTFSNIVGPASGGMARLRFYEMPTGSLVGQVTLPASLSRMSTDTLGRFITLVRRDNVVEIVALDSLLIDLGLDNMSVSVGGRDQQVQGVESKASEMFPNPCTSVVSFGLRPSIPTRISITNSIGVVVRELMPDLGTSRTSWDLIDTSNQRVAPGMYGFLLRTPNGRILESGTFIVAPE